MDISQISPLTKVHLLTNVPLDNKYTDTITFANTNAQYTFFVGKTKSGCSFENCRPTRNINQVKLPVNAYSVFDCNYLMFQSSNFSNKWLYAFITSIEYDTADSCIINFELDVMQTWYFNYTLKPSFVEREHVSDDTMGKHITDEGIDTGEFIRMGNVKTGHLDEMSIVASYSPVQDTPSGEYGSMYGGVYSGLKFFDVPSEFPGAFNDLIYSTIGIGKGDRIVNIFMCPTFLVCSPNTPVEKLLINPVTRPTTLNGYTPKNNKLYCYPYSFLYVTNNNGGGGIFKYEFMSNPNNPSFTLTGDYSPSPTVFLIPNEYKGITDNYDEKLTLNNYPLCCWNNDTFSQWLAMNKASLTMATAGSVATIGVGALTKNLAVTGIGVSQLTSQLTQAVDRYAQPQQAKGNVSGGGSAVAVGMQDFFFMPTTITREYAERIDSYFEMYGYKVNALKVPNVTGRPYWNFVKTINCVTTGSIPFADMSKIKDIYNNGITFWHGDFVGDYTLNNH